MNSNRVFASRDTFSEVDELIIDSNILSNTVTVLKERSDESREERTLCWAQVAVSQSEPSEKF